jgi:hypothetical protein
MRTERRRKSCRSAPAILLAAVTMLGAPIANAAAQLPAQTTREAEMSLAQTEKLPTSHPPFRERGTSDGQGAEFMDGWQCGSTTSGTTTLAASTDLASEPGAIVAIDLSADVDHMPVAG